jgi:integrase/recombinase XerD
MGQAKTLTKAELERTIHVVKSCSRYVQRDTTMLLLTYKCGMRIGEVASLLVSDVVNADGAIKAEIKLKSAQTKGSAQRVVFVPELMRKELRRYIQSVTKLIHSDYLFKTQKAKRFSANSATQHLQHLHESAGISGATAHSGRRTFITELAAKGVGVRVLAALAGHRSIQTTQRYIDVKDDIMRNAVKIIG